MSLPADLEKALGGPVERGASLAGRTSVRVGGPAELFAIVESEAALARALDVCARHAAPFRVLGGGANTVVSDAGVRGVVFKLSPKLAPEESAAEGESVLLKIGAGQPIARLVSWAREHACVGMEFLAGIPGTVGGAAVMNAGTKAGSFERICVEVGVCAPGLVRTLRAEELGFAYRSSTLPPGAVVTWARVRLTPGSAEQVARSREAMEQDLAYRRRTQPLQLPNFGSVFRNPPGDHAARLVEACGLKGERAGEAQISEQHANFVVNRGGARAADVLALMRRMQEAVFARFSVRLVPEVKLMGDFDPTELPGGIQVV